MLKNFMPRKARIDAPGALHHIIIRGIEKRRIFRNDEVTVAQFSRYAEDVIDRHGRIWDEAMLSAAIWLLRQEIGVRRIFYHTFDSGNILKGLHKDRCHPPRSRRRHR